MAESDDGVVEDVELFDMADELAAPGRTAVDDERPVAGPAGPVAVVSPPGGGRKTVLDYLAARLDGPVERVRLTPGTGSASLDGPTDGALVVEDCQHLYTRHVDGFDHLDAFRRRLADADTRILAGWNVHAWSYLGYARDLDRSFGRVVEVPPLDRAAVATLVRRRSDDLPAFRADDPEREPLFETRSRAVALPGGRTVAVPVPAIDRSALLARRTADEDPETAVFDRLTALADGNPATALALWATASEGGVVRPTDLRPAVDESVDLDRGDAFLLRVVLASERLRRETVAAVIDHPEERAARLARAGLVETTDGEVRVRAGAVPAATRLTDRRRIP